jgi:small subunit ribosomal protein S14
LASRKRLWKFRTHQPALRVTRRLRTFPVLEPPGFPANPLKIRGITTFGLQPTTNPLYFASRIMAKKSWIARNERKKQTVEKFAELRLKLKAQKDYIGLSMLPRDASPTRLINRCEITGRRRAFLRRFRLSRITFRELASAGMLPGVTKSSW